jgi:hypothetical protein
VDGNRFDELSRRLGRVASRRGVLQAALAGLLGAGVAGGSAGASARRTCRAAAASCTRDSQCCTGLCATERGWPRDRRNRCVCPEGRVWCPAQRTCAVIGSLDHCGGCGDACDPEVADGCYEGACSCGGVVCAEGATCVSGACAVTTCPRLGALACVVDTAGATYPVCALAQSYYRNDGPYACRQTSDCANGCGPNPCICAVGYDSGAGLTRFAEADTCFSIFPTCP